MSINGQGWLRRPVGQYQADVAVVGGGSAGVAAAVAAVPPQTHRYTPV